MLQVSDTMVMGRLPPDRRRYGDERDATTAPCGSATGGPKAMNPLTRYLRRRRLLREAQALEAEARRK